MAQAYLDIPHEPTTVVPADNSCVSAPSDEVTVLVTGYGPFRQDYPRNPSWLIAQSLPPLLTESPAHPSRIRILVHPSPVRVSYEAVHELIGSIYGHGAVKVDFVIHIGMAGGRDYYSMETVAHRDGYTMSDVDGKKLEEGYAESTWKGCPPRLSPTVHAKDVWRRWKSALPNTDVRPSTDAGRYLCDFIFYSSLAHFYQQELESGHSVERPVMFLHVPGEATDECIRTGREVAIALIQALADSRRSYQTLNSASLDAQHLSGENRPGQQQSLQRSFAA